MTPPLLNAGRKTRRCSHADVVDVNRSPAGGEIVEVYLETAPKMQRR